MAAYSIKVLIKGETEFVCKVGQTSVQTLTRKIRDGLKTVSIYPFEVRVRQCTKKKRLNG
jgi:hypothetical protein